MSLQADQIAGWLRRRLTASGARGFTVGLSGGLDSSVVARLCQIAAPEKVVGLVMPCESAEADAADALMVAQHFGIPTTTVDLAPAYHRLVADVSAGLNVPAVARAAEAATPALTRMALANLKARLRMSTLYFTANALAHLVAGTSNRSEILAGYFTKYGDGASDLLPIGGLLKGEVRALARELEVPEAILDKPPGAGFWPGQTDEGEMGLSYTDLDRYITEGPDFVSPALAMRIERLMRATGHKRALPPVPGEDDDEDEEK